MAPAVPVRPLGSQGLMASAQGLGCMSLTPFGGTGGVPEEEAVSLLRRAVELGVTLFNSSDLYGPYTNELYLGKAFEGMHDKVVVATKWGPMWGEGSIKMDASPANCRKCCEDQLQRLRVKAIDLWVMRGRDPKVPIEETMKTVKALVEERKVKYVGLSEVSPTDIRKAHAVHPITAIEMEWSLFSRDAEQDIVPVCRELGIGFLAYSPIGRGLLTGQVSAETVASLPDDDFRKRGQPRFQKENLEKNLVLVERVKALAAKKGCTPGQLALAWLHHQGDDVFPIPGTKRVKYLEENLAAVAVKLSGEEMAELEAAVPIHEVAGDRYPDMKHGSYHYDKH
ncbi:hypothetical protein WJX72_006969 [[Myrmecia] bisecta]|uniref:NADP-dependent oxidoreductase domain-containing protein n=1 Tax=[Myrmecia] bisecta TaxID=41462 RepID=A0AAW1P2F8_9CHLO